MIDPALALSGTLAVPAAWILIALSGLAPARSSGLAARAPFLAGAAAGLWLALVSLASLGAGTAAAVLPLGLPDLPFHVRLDPLARFFLLLLGAASAGVSLFAAGYFGRDGGGVPPGLRCLQYHVFLAAMALVIVADDAYLFMVAWETMALASYFLVVSEHRLPGNRRAGFLYLLIAHLGAVGILLAFGVLQGGTWQFTFDAMRAAGLTPAWASAAFLLALFGFGAKAGLAPLHIWLPEAHPAAPSPVSALMSGVMLKTAVYGMLRVTFDLLPMQLWWWGGIALGLGLFAALFGVIFAAVQTDMKRLLAYSSIENVGLVFVGLGLAVQFHVFGMPTLSALALAATLYHSLNHALFKSLLFLVTGSVLHATRERSLGRLGGLIHRMPWVAWLGLVGTLAIAGLPPLNGFVSEWLLLQAFLFAPDIPLSFVNMLVPLGASVVALVAALAAYVMVKFYGVIFLGQPREPSLAGAHDCGLLERLGLAWLAAGCVALGLFPGQVLRALDLPCEQLLGATLGAGAAGWWLLAPIAEQRAAYSPLLLAATVALIVLVAALAVRRLFHGRLRRAEAWNCGRPGPTPRMQDTAEGFGQPIRQIFEPFFRMRRELPTPFDVRPHYRVEVEDRFWYLLYRPLGQAVQAASALVARLQQGRIAVYLLYSFLTLVTLLAFVI
jgi:formate hydrogenlyase subunit 3/multisubunit Na+/H+ antiporter MnhD subunit